MKLFRAALAAVAVPAALASCAVDAPPVPAGPRYTCCETSDIERIYHPGERLTVHWIVIAGEPGGTATVQVELNASLIGPHGTVAELKSNPAGASTFAAEPVRPTGQPGEAPVSVIMIPATAEPGFYNLTTSVTEPGSTFSGGSIVEVRASSTNAV